jgi:pilus assembly protein CpaC
MKIRLSDVLILAGLAACASVLRASEIDTAAARPAMIAVDAGKSHIIDLPVNMERVSISAPETAEAVPVNARSVMVNGKTPGETSLVIWLCDGTRREYDVNVRFAASRLGVAGEQLQKEFGSDVQVTVDGKSVYLTGRVKNLFAAERAESIARSLGDVVDLLKVDVPEQEAQILLKVRFADVDRTRAMDLGVSFFGAPGAIPFTAKTGQFPASTLTSASTTSGAGGTGAASFSLSDALNLLLLDPHLNVGATIKDLESRSILQLLAEPNVLAMNGKEASFVAGGEFPFPTLQGGGGGVGQVTIQFREFGVRIHFLPRITPRGTIRLHVTPEVSSLDYANALSVSGFTVPALSTRRVDTEIELENGQSFAIAGLLDNRTTESLSKIPGLSNIPLLGKLFTSRSTSKSNSELLIIITPELVAPIPAGQNLPDIPRPQPFMEGPGILPVAPQTPGPEQTGPPNVKEKRNEMPLQEMQQLQKDFQAQPAGGSGQTTGFGASPASGGAASAAPASSGATSGTTDPANSGLSTLRTGK